MRSRKNLTGLTGLSYLICTLLISCNLQKQPQRASIDLQGEWQFVLDTADVGEKEQWFLKDFEDSVRLPGTTDTNLKGYRNRDTTTMHLNRTYLYEGPAWYRKKVNIPAEFEEMELMLILERTKSSKVWIDDQWVGESRLLQSPQQFDVPANLGPGDHYITIRIDNSLRLTPYGNVHIYTDETQTNWNGILGGLFLEAVPGTRISNLQVFPEQRQRKITVQLELENTLNLKEVELMLEVDQVSGEKKTRFKPVKIRIPCQREFTLEYPLGDLCSSWDEFSQPLYQLTATISNGEISDTKTVPFGMREFVAEGTQFKVNGKTTFLRGKNDAAVFPLTGHTPMQMEEWLRIFNIAKSYGINHYRFHSYCPPEAAFQAADRAGIYLQVELPFWGGLDSDSIAYALREEGIHMLKAYANHPSFVMFSHGNELWGGYDRVEKNILAFKAYDSRPLYTMGSNNGIGYVAPRTCSDYYVGARTPSDGDTTLTHTRLTQAFADSRDGGLLNTLYPSTEANYNYPVSQLTIPLVSHEIGQYQIFPDYSEIKKYTGVLRAWNLSTFRNRLLDSGMGEMDSLFQQASGAWSARCYKAEMEAALRTEGMGGFQLLDLQDFPGQGTALVGILDAFMDSKGVITPGQWKQSCNEVTVLLELPRYCWTSDEAFEAKVVIANYSEDALTHDVQWTIQGADGTLVSEGSFPAVEMKQGEITAAGAIKAELEKVQDVSMLTVTCTVSGTKYDNSYPIWVYPPDSQIQVPQELLVSGAMDAKTLDFLRKGGKVLLFPRPEDISDQSVPGLFPPDFWNFGMFKMISENNGKSVSPGTLGLLMDPGHPLFNEFPTEFHTDWQWFSIINAGQSFILDQTPHSYRPLVQVIDNLERNHKLGMIFEFRVGEGKLLVCTSPLDQLSSFPEARQLYRSMIQYISSGAFNPDYQVSPEFLTSLFSR